MAASLGARLGLTEDGRLLFAGRAVRTFGFGYLSVVLPLYLAGRGLSAPQIGPDAESRRAEVYYTAGLLPPGEHLLPRDTDLDVVDAVIRVHGPLVSGGSSVSNLSGTIIAPGIGAPSPSLLTVMRKTACGGRIPIRINLNRAIRDCRERILVQAGDELILQEAPCQAVTRYFASQFGLDLFFTLFKTTHGAGTHGWATTQVESAAHEVVVSHGLDPPLLAR